MEIMEKPNRINKRRPKINNGDYCRKCDCDIVFPKNKCGVCGNKDKRKYRRNKNEPSKEDENF